jgi:hypothetical protein
MPRMPELGTFQAAFLRALKAPAPPGRAVANGPIGRGITVHRNTVLKGLMDALADNYPTVERLVGRDWFVACAAEYVRAFPPAVPMLALYGAGFAEHLSGFGQAASLSYLSGVARIDRLWTEAHFARDAETLASNALARLPPAQLFEQRLAIHPATRFGWFKHSAVTIWLRNRPPIIAPVSLEIDGGDECALLTRPRGAVECIQIDTGACTFLTRIGDGASLGEAATAVLESDATADIAGHLARFISAGVFVKRGSNVPGVLP